MNTFP